MTLKAYRIEATSVLSIAGASVEQTSYVTKATDSRQQQSGATLNPPPFPLTYDAALPGVDFPFAWQFLGSLEHNTASQRVRREQLYNVLRSFSTDGNLPTTILDAPPDTTPLFMGRSNEIPLSNYGARRRSRFVLASGAWQDVKSLNPAVIPAGTYTLDSCQLLTEIQRHMLESTIDGGHTWSLWTEDEVLTFLNERISHFLSETAIIEQDEPIPVTAGTHSYDLPEDLILIERVAFDDGSTVTVLPKIDEFALDNGFPGWEDDSGTPFAYIEYPMDSLTIRLVPNPSADGTMLLRYVPNNAEITSVCSIINMPIMFGPYIKYGVMADMFSKQGEANDPQRAQYCENRYREGIEMALLLKGR